MTFGSFAASLLSQTLEHIHLAQSLYNNLFFCVSELMDLLLTVVDQSQADQPNNLAEGHPM